MPARSRQGPRSPATAACAFAPAAVATIMFAAVACASARDAGGGGKAEPGDPFARALREGPPPGYTPGQGPGDDDAGRPDGIKLEPEIGYISQASAEDPILERFSDFTRCYNRAGPAQRYAGGRVLLRFLIGRDGRPTDVLVVETQLGSFEVERCLVEVGRSLRFAPPEGDQATNFEYPIEFRSTRELPVLDQPVVGFHEVVRMRLAEAGTACGCPGAGIVNATIYVDGGGAVGSIGLASDDAIDDQRAACLVAQVRGWRVPAERRRAVWRVNAELAPPGCPGGLPAVVEPEEPPEPAPVRRPRRGKHRKR